MVSPIPKAIPCSGVDELRPIALTSVLSKLQESYVVSWLKEDIHGKLRRRSMVGLQGRRQYLLLYIWFINGMLP